MHNFTDPLMVRIIAGPSEFFALVQRAHRSEECALVYFSGQV